MEAIGNFFVNLWTRICTLLGSVNIVTSILDIVVVGLLIYAILTFLKDSNAGVLVKGLLLIAGLYVLARVLKLTVLTYIMNFLIANALILLAVIFQPELRRALEKAGYGKWGNRIFRIGGQPEDAITRERNANVVKSVCDGFRSLQQNNMGALIVLENTGNISEFISSSTPLDATPSAELFGTIFFEKTPLHDGAVLVRDGKIKAASCILPVSKNSKIDSKYGTRHRAAVGITEHADCMSVILSEESGQVSIAEAGVLKPLLSLEALKEALEHFYHLDDVVGDDRNPFKRGKGDKNA